MTYRLGITKKELITQSEKKVKTVILEIGDQTFSKKKKFLEPYFYEKITFQNFLFGVPRIFIVDLSIIA